MFIKPFKVKSNTQIKGSEVKKIKTRLQAQFPNLSDEDLSILFSNKSAYQSVKIETHSELNVTVLSKDKRPMFFEISGNTKLFPTLYACWQVPSIVSYFTTFANVLPKLANGADLMVPGIIREGSDLRAYGRWKKDQVCAVNLSSNKSAVGVGMVARSGEDMYMSGGHGIGVKMLHVFGDHLWNMEPTVTQQIPLCGPTRSVPTLNENDFPALGSEPPKEQMENLVLDSPEENENAEEDEEEEQESPDDILKGIFLGSLKINKKQLSSQLPLLVSTFYPNFVQKEMDSEKTVNIKETSYKKVSTFIKKMSESGYITLKEETKGIEKIVAVNFEHPDILRFSTRKKKTDNPEVSEETQTPQLLLTKMTELFVVNENTKGLFNLLGVPVGKSLDKTQIKNYVKDYVGRNKLYNNLTKLVTMDEVLKSIVGATSEDQNSITIENLIEIVNDRMDNTYEMRSQAGPVTKGGKKAVIQITTANRMGNKKVTLIENLDAFGINVAEFSKSIKVAVAASTTMTKVPGTNKDQFLVQGNHVRFIYDLLTQTYKIPRASITGLEFAKKERKKK